MTDLVAGGMVDPRAALAGRPEEVAPLLLGARLVSHIGPTVVVRITEVEAYGGVGEDPASHAHRGPTRRNASMFLGPGHLYCYFTYGMHWCANIVTGPALRAGAVLIRAGEVVDGIEVVRSRRQARRDRDLARGPARLAQALALDGAADGIDLLAPDARVCLELGRAPTAWATSGRTGVRQGARTPWRFFLVDDPWVSDYRPAAPRPPGPRGAEASGEGLPS